jgi:hypothetical protein
MEGSIVRKRTKEIAEGFAFRLVALRISSTEKYLLLRHQIKMRVQCKVNGCISSPSQPESSPGKSHGSFSEETEKGELCTS